MYVCMYVCLVLFSHINAFLCFFLIISSLTSITSLDKRFFRGPISPSRSAVWLRFRSVAVSNPHEDRLLEQLLRSNNRTLLNIPIADVGDILQVELGLVLKKITKVVRYTATLCLYTTVIAHKPAIRYDKRVAHKN